LSHIFRGQPKRHLLTTGWGRLKKKSTGWGLIISEKRLPAGDSVLLIRDAKKQPGIIDYETSEMIYPFKRIVPWLNEEICKKDVNIQDRMPGVNLVQSLYSRYMQQSLSLVGPVMQPE
jgi:hypothetical protein